jgi:hypothetical protein
MTDFDQFWAAYPRRVGKLAAQKAYMKARKIATQEELLKGVAAYIRHKPAYADFCHPTTFLSQGRWMDELEDPETRPCRRCGTVPKCQSYAECNERLLVKRQVSRSEAN